MDKIMQGLFPLLKHSLPAAVSIALISATLEGQIPKSDMSSHDVPAQQEKPARSAEKTEQRITVNFEETPLHEAIDEVARRSGRWINYVKRVLPENVKVTYQAKNATAIDVITAILRGTGVRAEPGANGSLKLIRDESATPIPQEKETITGVVFDSATKQGIAGVTVEIIGIKSMTSTDEQGRFTIRNVPVGHQTLSARVLGYRTKTLDVDVVSGGRTTATIFLAAAPTALSEVITTATGAQKRYEVGNSITSINVDSLLQVVPARNLTDVLDAGRVPGLVVSRGSGAPGAPARIRMRGVGSINASNDPIIIVDGVRLYSEQTTNTKDAEYSVLDRIDVNTIERIDVLKGASASAQYGSDAANGVIIIKTKKGTPGQTRWTFRMNREIADQPWSVPDSYLRYGVSPLGGRPRVARLGSEGSEFYDLQVFNLLSNERTSVLGRGDNTSYSGSVSGGTQTIRFMMGGAFKRDIGQLKMSRADRAFVESKTGTSVPNWMERPEQFSSANGTTSLVFYPSRSLTITLSNSLNKSERSETPYKTAFGALQIATAEDSILTLDKIKDFRRRITYRDWSTLNSLSSTWTPNTVVTMEGNVGYQVVDSRSRSILRRGDCTNLANIGDDCQENTGSLKLSRLGRSVMTATLRASTRIPQRYGVRLTPTIGFDYTSQLTSDNSMNARDLMQGSESINGAGAVEVSELNGAKRSFGVITNMGVALFNQRIFTSIGTRIDASSVLGWQVRPMYPKLDLSYVMSDEVWVPEVISALRLRVAYGHSARQPAIGATSRTYTASDAVQGGVVIPTLTMKNVGNPTLRPERSEERELGFDIGLFRDRLTLGMTHYTTLTKDMLVQRYLPPSLGGWSWTSNLGTVSNRGFEAEFSARIIDSDRLAWSIQTNLSTYANRLRSVASDFDVSFSPMLNYDAGNWLGQRYAVGYPIDGWWMLPVVTYEDVNGDDALNRKELLRSDSAVFVGSPTPKYNTSFSSTLSLWSGRIQLNTNASYINRVIQSNNLQIRQIGLVGNAARAFNDPTTSLETQALAWSGYMFLHPVSTFRVTSMSLSMYVSPRIARMAGARAMSVSLTGNNLGLWTNYSGVDPDVNESIVGSRNLDSGQLPMPRRWGFNVSLSY